MTKVLLSVATGVFTDKKRCQPVATFETVPFELDLTDHNSLVQFFKERIHAVWRFIDGYRSGETTDMMYAIAHDFDQGNVSFAERVQQFDTGCVAIVYTTTSHTVEHPKVRVIQWLKTPITNREQMQSVNAWCKQQYPDADASVYRISQPLYPACKKDGRKKTAVDKLFQLQVLQGEGLVLPPEALTCKITKARTPAGDAWAPASDQFAVENQKELDRVLAWYKDHPIIKSTRENELLALAAKYRQCGCTEDETLAELSKVNKAYVQPMMMVDGHDPHDKTLTQITDRVYGADLKAYGEIAWPTLAAVNKSASESPDALYDAVNQSKICRVSRAQCFIRRPGEEVGSLYYMVGNSKCQFMVGQGCTYFPVSQARANGIFFTEDTPIPSMLNFSDVMGYMQNSRHVSMRAIFCDVRAYLADFLVFSNPLDYSYLALWIIGTYSYVMWNAYPYVSIRGVPESGKTTVLERIASIAFNAREPGGITPAALREAIHINGGTVCIDEAERLGGKKRDDAGIDALEILNLGYKRGLTSSKMKQVKGGNFATATYNVYGPKAVAGIKDLAPTLRSRCHEIVMQPITEEERIRFETKRYQNVPSIANREDRIRNDLYIATLQNVYTPPSMVPASGEIVGRAFELWNPIMFLASLVDDGDDDEPITREMKTLAGVSSQATRDAISRRDYPTQVIIALRDMFTNTTINPVPGISGDDDLVYTVDAVYKYFCNRPEFSWFDSDGNKKMWLTRQVLDLGFKSKQCRITLPGWPQSEPTRVYLFDKELFASIVIHRLGQNVRPSDLTNFKSEDE